MRMLRPVIAADPRFFGRRVPGFILDGEPLGWSVSEDVKLFATAFSVGFLFVSVLIF